MRASNRIGLFSASIAILGATLVAAPAHAVVPTEAPDSKIARYADTVTAFTDDNPAPTITAEPGSSSFDSQAIAVLEYWKETPWEAVWGQWGYAVTSSQVSLQTGTDGVNRPVVTTVVEGANGDSPIDSPEIISRNSVTAEAPAVSDTSKVSVSLLRGLQSGKTYGGEATLHNSGGTLTGTWQNTRHPRSTIATNVVIGTHGNLKTVNKLAETGWVLIPYRHKAVTSVGGIQRSAVYGLALVNGNGNVYADDPYYATV